MNWATPLPATRFGLNATPIHFCSDTRDFPRHMKALRVAQWGLPAPPSSGPVIIYSNHPAWWDAAVYILTAETLFPGYESYAPIDAAMLKQYGVFGRIGAFGVDLETPRERPLGLKPGVARLVEMAPDCTILPLAIEYSFWLERGAEACIAFGAPMRGYDLLDLSRAARLERLEQELTGTLDRLSADVAARDPARFRALIEGRAGVGGLYDGWRRMIAALRGRSFDPSHEGHAS